jgi:predicted regulator of Ras-like GTPase activity (Roadblock/LC7/MglB family)
MGFPCNWKDADGVAAMRDFLRQPPPRKAAIRDLMTELLSPTPYARRCAADLARRVSAREPGILGRYAGVLIDLVAELPPEQWQARGYTALAAALNASACAERMRLAPLVRVMVEDERNAVRAMALEAFAILAVAEPELREEVMVLLEQARREGTCAMRSRARRMLPALLSTELKARPGKRG